ncbi:MAG TPA: GNAT family N-acetyltransferase [Rhizomicrobium sp.]|jgi:ribosomal protein S18 acetylase RimI-like enzyme|nr:GNAT family N-acetyltransferase [Rhizomicrobium sp.]
MSEDRHALLAAAASPRRATVDDTGTLARLFAAAFASDPVMNWIARPGARRAVALEQFFFWLLKVRAIPYGEVWLSADGGVGAAWLPPGAEASPGSFLEQMRLMPMFLRLCGFPRLLRGSAMGDTMEKNHPHTPHFYLAFIAVAPRLQGLGLGGAMLEATLKRADAVKAPAYLENSNSRNTRLYERAGFVAGKNIAPAGAPPLIAMWRNAAST